MLLLHLYQKEHCSLLPYLIVGEYYKDTVSPNQNIDYMKHSRGTVKCQAFSNMLHRSESRAACL